MPRCPQNPGRRCPARGLSLWGASGCICSGTKGSQTHRWRGTDSNHRYQEDKRPLRDGFCLASVTVPVPEGIHFFGYGGPMVRIHFPPATVGLSLDFSFLYRKAGSCRGVRGPGQAVRSAETVGLVNITPTAGNISVGPYSSTAAPARAVSPTVVALVRQARS